DGYFCMKDEADYVKIMGGWTADTKEYYKTSAYGTKVELNLLKGTIELHGNFTNNLNDSYSFCTSPELKMLVCGEGEQKFTNNNSRSYNHVDFANLQITNENTVWGEKICFALGADSVISSSVISYDADLNGYTLTVNGDLTQNGGKLYINGGNLTVNGNLSQKDGYFCMKDEADYVKIMGDWTADTREYYKTSAYGTKGELNLLKGTIELHGNFTNNLRDSYSFCTSSELKMLVCGEGEQKFTNNNTYNYSYVDFANLQIKNKNIVIGNNILLNLSSDSTTDNAELSCGLNLNGHTLTVTNDLTHTGGTITVGNGKLLIAGNYNGYTPEYDEEGNITAYNSGGSLNMQNNLGYVSVGGDFTTLERGYDIDYGVIELKGDFIYRGSSYDYGSWSSSPQYIFSGTEPQSIISTNGRKVYLNNVLFLNSDTSISDGTNASYGAEITLLENCDISLESGYMGYDGTERIPTVIAKNGDKNLVKNTDYVLTLKDNVELGTATATITGIGAYYGTVTLEFEIVMLETPEVTAPTAKDLTYTGKPQELIEAGSTTGGTLMYKLDDGEYSENIPVATDVGTYMVYYKVIGNETYWGTDEQSVIAEIKEPVLSAPKNVTAKLEDTSIVISWDEVEFATAYEVYRDETLLGTAETNSFTDEEVEKGKTYTYSVKAYSEDFDIYSEASEAVTISVPADTIPQNVKAVAGEGKITITWDSVDGATKYRVQRLNGTSWSSINYPTATSYVDTNVTAGTTYKYRVLAYVNNAWSTASSVVTATPVASIIPQNVKAVAGDGKITITWSAVSGATKYRVQRLNGTSWSTVNYPTATSYVDTAVTAGTTYKYRVLAYVNNAWSTASSVVSATPVASTIPQNVKAVAGDGKITITWSAVSGATKYRVQRLSGTSWTT
ncbi:MAG: hypothetical protein IJZ65_10855, partial [Ruminiclostridium sp.]|nr:hypothetical protein [Ruminiclostridium sp.]